MTEVNILKKQVKKYIDTADEKVVKMVYAMLEVNAEKDWWDDLPEHVKAEIEEAQKELHKGKGISHAKVKKLYPQWFPK
jgi:TRAP-type C4-dicarboxylate transport system substrate-binding protein